MVNLLIGFISGVLFMMIVRTVLYRMNRIAVKRKIEVELNRIQDEIKAMTDGRVN